MSNYHSYQNCHSYHSCHDYQNYHSYQICHSCNRAKVIIFVRVIKDVTISILSKLSIIMVNNYININYY